MTHFYLIHWKRGGSEELIERDADDIDDLYKKLEDEFKDDEFMDGIRIYGHKNYRYITNVSHWWAAGFPVVECSVGEAQAPAHFNRDFFYVLRFYEI